MLVFLGRRGEFHVAVAVQQQVRAQLQVLVMDMQRCGFTFHSVSSGYPCEVVAADRVGAEVTCQSLVPAGAVIFCCTLAATCGSRVFPQKHQQRAVSC